MSLLFSALYAKCPCYLALYMQCVCVVLSELALAGSQGLINDPNLDGTFSINKGLKMARALLLDINALGATLPSRCHPPPTLHILSNTQ